jgi:hypothetical protein
VSRRFTGRLERRVREARAQGGTYHRVPGLFTTSGQQHIAKLDFSTQGFWALGALSHYIGRHAQVAATLPAGTAFRLGITYAHTSGLWGVPLTQVHSHLLSNSIGN